MNEGQQTGAPAARFDSFSLQCYQEASPLSMGPAKNCTGWHRLDPDRIAVRAIIADVQAVD